MKYKLALVQPVCLQALEFFQIVYLQSIGKFWAHEHWNLDTPPDIVTFSKKAQTAGYYYGDDAIRPSQGYRQ
jgi:hypothetical protein